MREKTDSISHRCWRASDEWLDEITSAGKYFSGNGAPILRFSRAAIYEAARQHIETIFINDTKRGMNADAAMPLPKQHHLISDKVMLLKGALGATGLALITEYASRPAISPAYHMSSAYIGLIPHIIGEILLR